jgi:hypothetical protein
MVSGGNRSRQSSLTVWPVVAFAAFAIAGFHALAYAISNAGPEPTFDAIVFGIDWPRLVVFALAIAAPAGILAAAQARLLPARGVDTPIATLMVAAVALLALWVAYQTGPGLVTATGA